MASYAKRTAIKPQRAARATDEEGAASTVKQVVEAGKNAFGAAKNLVPGVLLKSGLEKAKGALKKITRR